MYTHLTPLLPNLVRSIAFPFERRVGKRKRRKGKAREGKASEKGKKRENKKSKAEKENPTNPTWSERVLC